MHLPQKKSFRGFFKDHVPMKVPRYQRSYAWQTEEVQDFVHDIRHTAARWEESPPEADLHFFGGIVSVRRDDPRSQTTIRWDIVDGQQRLATVALTAALLTEAYARLGTLCSQALEGDLDEEARADLARTKGRCQVAEERLREEVLSWVRRDPERGESVAEARLTLSEIDRHYFRYLIGQSEVEVSPTARSHERLRWARGYIERHLLRPVLSRRDLDIAQKLERLRGLETALLDSSYVVHIFTTYRAEAYQLFSILNDRGRNLTDGDLLRTRTLELLENHRELQDEAATRWETVLDHPPSSVDAFLRAYYASRTGARAPSRGLYDNFSRRFLPEEAASRDDAVKLHDFIVTLERASRVYHDIASSTWPFQPPTVPVWDQKRLERLISVLGRSGDIPLLLAAREHKDEVFFGHLVHAMEHLAFRYTVARGHSGTLSEAYFKEANALRERPDEYSIPRLMETVGVMVALKSSDEQFSFALRDFLKYRVNSSSSNRKLKHVLTTIDDYWGSLERLREIGEGEPSPNREAPYDLDQIQIEHVYPLNPQPEESDETLDELVNDFGNLAFWQGDENVLASNKPYRAKKTDLSRARAELTREAGRHDEWNADTVLNRREVLIERILWIYGFPSTVRDAVRLVSRSFWLVYHDLREGQDVYADVRGESYHYRRSIPNGARIATGDVLVTFSPSEANDENKIFGVGLVGEILEDEDYRTAFYSHYLDLPQPVPLSALDSEPRANTRNAINQVSVELVRELIPERMTLDSLPPVPSAEEIPEDEEAG